MADLMPGRIANLKIIKFIFIYDDAYQIPRSWLMTIDYFSYRLNFYPSKKNEIQHHS